MKIYVNQQDINDAIRSIEKTNGEYLIIKGNCILIDSILTIFPIQESYELFNCFSFSFSYNDTVVNDYVEIEYTKEDSSCYSFLKKSELIDEHNLELINQKALDSVLKAKCEYLDKFKDINNRNEIDKKVDSIVYNEALIYLSNGINKGDKEFVQEDFKSKYEAYKKSQDEKTQETVTLLEKLHLIIFTTRCYGDGE